METSNRPLLGLTDEQLVEKYQEAKAYADECAARLDVYKEELSTRFLETGQLKFESATHTVTMKASPPSMAWLKREYGFEQNEVPSACMTEKVSIVPDWEKVKDWIEKDQNMDWRFSYVPSIKAKPMKV